MRSKSFSDKYIDKCLLLVYLLINSLFIFKYIPVYPCFATIIYCVVVVSAYFFYQKYLRSQIYSYYLAYFFILILFFLSVFLLIRFDPHTTTVSRWSALYYWSDKLFSGEYPYLAATHVSEDSAGSPFPVWQVLHIPFYFLGEIGISHLVILLFLIIILYKFKHRFNIVLFLFMLCLCPSFWWEIMVRSDLMNNIFVCILFITVFHYKFRQTRSVFLIGFLIGAFICTRLFTIIPLAIYFIPWFLKNERASRIKMGSGILLGFILPFVPLMIWNWDMLFYSDKSPIILQTRQGSIYTAFAGLLFIVFASFIWKTYKQYAAIIASVLFIFVFLTFAQFVLKHGLIETLYNDIFDISYFGIAIPFILFGLSYRNNYEKTDFLY